MSELDTRPTNDKVRRRDRAVDVVRLTALVIVMFGHCALLLATIDSGGVQIGNLLGAVPAIAPVTWAVQVMPLFFLAGGAAGAYGWHAGTPWGVWFSPGPSDCAGRCTGIWRRGPSACSWSGCSWVPSLRTRSVAKALHCVLAVTGAYEVALVVTGVEQVSNTSPPTLLLGLHCTWMSCTFVVVAGHLRRWTALGGFLLAAVAARVCAGWR